MQKITQKTKKSVLRSKKSPKNMIILLSPSKTQSFKESSRKDSSTPIFLKESKELRSELKKLSDEEIQKLMKLSPKIAATVNQKSDSSNAITAFEGTVYNALKEEELTISDLAFAQKHLRIISGLYGLLKPLDEINLYRLDMGTRLKTDKGKNLYEFWGDKIQSELKGEQIINLASSEYSDSIKDQSNFLNITFKEKKGDDLKVIGIHAKKARGTMAAYIIKNQITDPEKIKDFKKLDYKFNKTLSSDTEFVFTR